MNTHEDMKQWRHDAKDWTNEASQWHEEQARAKAALAELQGFLGAHGDQLVSYAASVEKLAGMLDSDQQHDAAKVAHRDAKALQHSLKAEHHDLMARVNALRSLASK